MFQLNQPTYDQATVPRYISIEWTLRLLHYCCLHSWILIQPPKPRPQETYGESPTHNGAMCAGFIRGLQGNHSSFMRIAATVKHYAFCECER